MSSNRPMLGGAATKPDEYLLKRPVPHATADHLNQIVALVEAQFIAPFYTKIA